MLSNSKNTSLRPVTSVLAQTTVHTPRATPSSAHAALLLLCPIFTCAVLYMTRVSTLTHMLHSCTAHHTGAVGETQSAWSGQLSCEVLYVDSTYADPFRFFFFFFCWLPHRCLFVSRLCAEFCLGEQCKKKRECHFSIQSRENTSSTVVFYSIQWYYIWLYQTTCSINIIFSWFLCWLMHIWLKNFKFNLSTCKELSSRSVLLECIWQMGSRTWVASVLIEFITFIILMKIVFSVF